MHAAVLLLLIGAVTAATIIPDNNVSCAVGNTTLEPEAPQLYARNNVSCGLFISWTSLADYNSNSTGDAVPRDAIIGVTSAVSKSSSITLHVGLWTVSENGTLGRNFTLLGYMPHAVCQRIGHNTNTRFYNCSIHALLSHFNVAEHYTRRTLMISFHLPFNTTETISVGESLGADGWAQWPPMYTSCLSSWSTSTIVPFDRLRIHHVFVYPAHTEVGLYDTPLAKASQEPCPAKKHIVGIQPVGDIVIVDPTATVPFSPVHNDEENNTWKYAVTLGVLIPTLMILVLLLAFGKFLFLKAKSWWFRRSTYRVRITGYNFGDDDDDDERQSVANYDTISATELQPIAAPSATVTLPPSTVEENDMTVVDLNAEGEPTTVNTTTLILETQAPAPPFHGRRNRFKQELKPNLPPAETTFVLMAPEDDRLD